METTVYTSYHLAPHPTNEDIKKGNEHYHQLVNTICQEKETIEFFSHVTRPKGMEKRVLEAYLPGLCCNTYFLITLQGLH